MKIFSRDKFIESLGTEEYEASKRWVDACNGKEVINGMCGSCIIDDSWCIEVSDTTYKSMIEDKKEIDSMNKFKVGDIVKGIDESRYVITNKRMTRGRVIKVHKNGMFDVKIIEHEYKGYIGDECLDLDPRYFELAKPFTKSDLKDGDIVTLRNGDGLAYIRKDFIDMTDRCDNGLCNISALLKYLTYNDCGYKDENYDILKIERATSYDVVYEREEKQEVKEMTVEEISKALGYEVKIIKRK